MGKEGTGKRKEVRSEIVREERRRRIRRACQHVVIHDQLQCAECVHTVPVK